MKHTTDMGDGQVLTIDNQTGEWEIFTPFESGESATIDSGIATSAALLDMTAATSATISDDFLISNGITAWSEDYIEIPLDLNCSANQFITIKDHKMLCVDLPISTYIQNNPTTTIIKEVPMWTVSNILVVALIAAVVYKMMPKLTLYNFFRACWKLVIHPFKKKEEEITATWKDAKDDTK